MAYFKDIKMMFGLITILSYVNQRIVVLCFDIEQQFSNSFRIYV